MIIQVTEKDIKKGYRGINNSCPIALSLNRRGFSAIVKRATVLINSKVFMLPLKAQEFIRRFDHGNNVKPFRFKLMDL